MHYLFIGLVAAVAGATTACVQSRMFTGDRSVKKTVSAHLDDLRLYYRLAIAAMLVVSGALLLLFDWLDVLRFSPVAFMLSWLAVGSLHLKRFVNARPSESTL